MRILGKIKSLQNQTILEKKRKMLKINAGEELDYVQWIMLW